MLELHSCFSPNTYVHAAILALNFIERATASPS
jgi:hypothetical protein